MINSILDFKKELLSSLHSKLAEPVMEIAKSHATHQNKAKEVNSIIYMEVRQVKERVLGDESILSIQERQTLLLIIQYAASVVSLEYRHSVWAYEYMSLSRRVGELWERFCSAAWDCPSRPAVERFDEPSFAEVRREIQERLSTTLDLYARDSKTEILHQIEPLFGLIGHINMREDEVFKIDGTPHVIDFKSGFGSNEKGNTMRLLTVGKAYKLWDPNTKLLLLVRQKENNNYLNQIKNSGLWEVHCGDDAYGKIDELTGANTLELRKTVFDFPNDLSAGFLADLDSQLANLVGYLEW